MALRFTVWASTTSPLSLVCRFASFVSQLTSRRKTAERRTRQPSIATSIPYNLYQTLFCCVVLRAATAAASTTDFHTWYSLLPCRMIGGTNGNYNWRVRNYMSVLAQRQKSGHQLRVALFELANEWLHLLCECSRCNILILFHVGIGGQLMSAKNRNMVLNQALPECFMIVLVIEVNDAT